MSTPRPSPRITSLEKRTTDIEANIEELSADTAESLKVLKQDIKALFDHTQRGFNQARFYTKENIETRLDQMKEDIASIKATQEQILTLLQQKPVE